MAVRWLVVAAMVVWSAPAIAGADLGVEPRAIVGVTAGMSRTQEEMTGANSGLDFGLVAKVSPKPGIRVLADWKVQFHRQLYLARNPDGSGATATPVALPERTHRWRVGADLDLTHSIRALSAVDQALDARVGVGAMGISLDNAAFPTVSVGPRVGCEVDVRPAGPLELAGTLGVAFPFVGTPETLALAGVPKRAWDAQIAARVLFGSTELPSDPKGFREGTRFGLELAWDFDTFVLAHDVRTLHRAHAGLLATF